jgi:hypothetical protein
VSNAGGEGPDRGRSNEWDRLELAVRRLLDEYQKQRRRAVAAEARIVELESALRDLSGGGPDPLVLGERVSTLEIENGAMRKRLKQAHAEVERIIARLQFMEGQR